jgi:xanthine dehydrogenase accessory factor
MKPLKDITIAVKGAGEMASAVAHRLYMANFRRIFLLEQAHPLAVRRLVSFCEAVYNGRQTVEGVTAVLVQSPAEFPFSWKEGVIPVLVDPKWDALASMSPDVCVDAILAKKNLGTTLSDASTVIGLGPGFTAGKDVHLVIETNRGHHLGRVITSGSAADNTGIPGEIAGYAAQRVLRSPADGRFESTASIGDGVKAGDTLGHVKEHPVRATVDGIVRGLIRPGTQVTQGLKIGDIDPRGNADHCPTISDKARAVAGSVLEAILRRLPSLSDIQTM